MRRLFGMKELHLFTFGDETRLPFRLNPFELFPGENLSAHVDMLKACFVNAMPMEAALPMVFEEALYRCYQFYGWNTEEGINRFTDDSFTEDGMYFPILQDMIPAIEEVVAEKHFSATMQGDYIGSLAGRISNLLVGAKGRMLNCRRSFDILGLPLRITAWRGCVIMPSSASRLDSRGRYSSRAAVWRAMLEVEIKIGRTGSPLAARKRWYTVPAAR